MFRITFQKTRVYKNKFIIKYMHWTQPFFISQVIQVSLILVLISGLFTTSRALSKLEKEFRNPLILILVAFIFYIFLALAFSILVYKRTDYESYLWILPPIIGLIGSLGLVLGGKRLLEAVQSPGEEEN